MKNFVFISLAFCGIALIVTDVYANREGITGRTSIGCGGSGCHANQPSNLTTVLLEGERMVNPNTIYTYTLRVRHSSAVQAGFNLAALNSNGQPAGMLQYPSTESNYVKSQNGELTHRDRRFMTNQTTYREASWQIQWRAPETPGIYTIRAVGNATDGDGRASANDQWNYLPTTTITVRGIILNAPTSTASYCAGDTVSLQWTSYGISTTNILYSSNGGTSWVPVGTIETRDGANSFRYAIPQTISAGSNHIFRIVSAEDELLGANTPALTINPKTAIRTQPSAPGPVCEGGSATLSVVATGAALTYQWQHNGTPVPGGTSAQLALSNIQPAQAGQYLCVVSGACGSVQSSPVQLTVTPLPRIVSQSSDTTLAEGNPLELQVRATVDSGIAYQWLRNGTPIPGATTSWLRLSGALSDTGTYQARLTNTCGTAESAPIRVRIAPTTTVEDVPSTVLSIYPQPAYDVLYVELTQPADRIELRDLSGRLVQHWMQPAEPRIRIELKDSNTAGRFPAGVYLLTAWFGDMYVSAPIVIEPNP
jgi:hypothetical protein